MFKHNWSKFNIVSLLLVLSALFLFSSGQALAYTSPHGSFMTTGRQDLCKNCHSAHSSLTYKLLKGNTEAATCYVCHDGTGANANTASEFDVVNKPSHHKVPEGRTNCTDCHNPHLNGSTTNPWSYKLLSYNGGSYVKGTGKDSDGNPFCWNCHGTNGQLSAFYSFNATQQTNFTNSEHNGYPKKNDNITMADISPTKISCLHCHENHGSQYTPLLKETLAENGNTSAVVSGDTIDFCITCHNQYNFSQALDNVNGNVYFNNSSKNFSGSTHDNKFQGKNGCIMCHEPHGTANPAMLEKPFPDKKQGVNNWENAGTPTINDKNIMCFKCHDWNYYLGNNPKVGSKFGNGNGTNYHWHVGNYNLSCRVCHDPHDSMHQVNEVNKQNELNNTHLVNFDWSVANGSITKINGKIGFYSTGKNAAGDDTGFACYLNCRASHSPKGYVRNPTSSPSLNCAACHDYNEFKNNSAHPVVIAGAKSNKMVECITCHDPDHTKHSASANPPNPYGLLSSVDWKDPNNGYAAVTPNPQAIPNFATTGYRGFCFTCHGSSRAIQVGESTNPVTWDMQTKFEGKPHSKLFRTLTPYGVNNQYGTASDGSSRDIPCLVCHENHASSNVKLLKRDIDHTDTHAIDAQVDVGKINACLDCHDGYPSSMDINSLYNAPTAGGHFIKSDPTEKLICTECHSPHGTSNSHYLLDVDKYSAGVTWPTLENDIDNPFKVRDFCLTCHPTSDGVARNYSTAKTIKVGTAPNYIVTIQPLPSTVSSHASSSQDACITCHDPHKPWPPTGSNADCYKCHGTGGLARDIQSKMGFQNDPSAGGLASHHTIYDATTANTNTCMTSCHQAHPHQPRSNLINKINEKTVCLTCHDVGGVAPKTIDSTKFNGKPHDYEGNIETFSDGSVFKGTCTKCHDPHGSNNIDMLRWPDGDTLCEQCHDGKHTDGNGVIIEDIKTIYDNKGHAYKYSSPDPNNPVKLHCDECHIPHGSSNDKYLRDVYLEGQTVYNTDSNGNPTTPRSFPSNLSETSSRRVFCTTCHKLDNGDGANDRVKYTSPSAPNGSILINELKKNTPHGFNIVYHADANVVSGAPAESLDPNYNCLRCHSPHDPTPTGANEKCYTCHGGDNSLSMYNIDQQMGQIVSGSNTWPDGVGGRTTTSPNGIISYHKITDSQSADTNTCMVKCHAPHSHNPRANMLKDVRSGTVDSTSPTFPGGATITATAKSNSQIDVAWTAANSGNIKYYLVYKDGNMTTPYGILNSIVTGGTITFHDGGITGTHNYTVMARNASDNGTNTLGPSNNTSTSYTADTISPSVPTNLVVNVNSSDILNLSWTASTDASGVKGYNIYRSTSPLGPFTKIGYSGTNSFVDGAGVQDSLSPLTSYWYQVSAIDKTADNGGNGNESALTSAVGATTNPIVYNATTGTYQNGNDILELYDSNNLKSNSFVPSTSMRVKVTTPNVNLSGTTGLTRQVRLYNKTGGLLSTYTLTQRTTTTPYTYDVTFTAPATAGVYYIAVEINRTITPVYRYLAYESINIGASTEKFKTFSDSGRTNETNQFNFGDTVYVLLTGVPGNPVRTVSTANSTNTLVNFTNNTYNTAFDVSTSTEWPPAWDAVGSPNDLKYNFKLTNPGTMTAGNWYSIYNRFRDSAGNVLAQNYKMIKIISVDTTPPNVPTGLAIQGQTDTSVTLNWSTSGQTSDINGYTVYRSADGGTTWIKAGSVSAATGTFNDRGLKPSTAYQYKVSAFDNSGNVATTGIVSGATAAPVPDTTAPAVPTGINTTSYSTTAIEVSWQPNAIIDGVAGYIVYRVDGANTYKLGATTSTTWIDNNLPVAKSYGYLVAAYDNAGNISPISSVVNGATQSVAASSIEGALCLSCHDGTQAPPGSAGAPIIGDAFKSSKHNVDVAIETMPDGSKYYGNCTKCHVPHGSSYPKLLKMARDNNLCFSCHSTASASGKYSGERDFNMTPHSWDSSHAPSASGTPLKQPSSAAGDEGKCLNCHAPHAKKVNGDPTKVIKSSARNGTDVSLNSLCQDCHSENKFGAWNGFTTYNSTAHSSNSLMQWDSSYGPGECTNCHDPHGTDYGHLLKKAINTTVINGTTHNKNELCLTCHDRPAIISGTPLFEGSNAYTTSDHSSSAQWFDTSTKRFSPFEKGVCMNCHTSHGNSDAYGYIPHQLVMRDQDIASSASINENNDICYNCHDSEALANRGSEVSPATIPSTYYYTSLTPGYPTSYLATSSSVTSPDGIPIASIQVTGESIYVNSAHGRPASTNPLMVWPGNSYYPAASVFGAVAGQCINCHDPHGTYIGGSKVAGATFNRGPDFCLACHDGTPVNSSWTDSYGQVHNINVASQFGSSNNNGHKVYTSSYITTHKPNETFIPGDANRSVGMHVQCADCHNAHRATRGAVINGLTGNPTNSSIYPTNTILRASGVSIPNASTASAIEVVTTDNPNEICMKCHANYSTKTELPTGTFDVLFDFTPVAGAVNHGVYDDSSLNYTNAALPVKGINPYISKNGTYSTLTKRAQDIMARQLFTGYGKLYCSDCHEAHNLNDSATNPYSLRLASNNANANSDVPTSLVSTTTYNGWPLIVKFCLGCHNYNAYYKSGATGSSTAGTQLAHGSSHEGVVPTACDSCHGAMPSGNAGYNASFDVPGFFHGKSATYPASNGARHVLGFIRGKYLSDYKRPSGSATGATSRSFSQSNCYSTNGSCGAHNSALSGASATY